MLHMLCCLSSSLCKGALCGSGEKPTELPNEMWHAACQGHAVHHMQGDVVHSVDLKNYATLSRHASAHTVLVATSHETLLHCAEDALA